MRKHPRPTSFYMPGILSTSVTGTVSGVNGFRLAVGFTRRFQLSRLLEITNMSDLRTVSASCPTKWRPTFNFPENGPAGFSQTVYYIDYQGARIIWLNTNEDREAQVPWIKRVLENNPNRWTFVTFHHPLYSTKEGRDNEELREMWKPLFDAYGVALVLQGHDHTYGRGTNKAVGANTRADGVGPVYVVSVSGPKMYKLTDKVWFDRGAKNTQLYQVIDVGDRKLEYRAYTTTSELYDAFDLIKRGDKPNLLIDRKPTSPERRQKNALPKK